VNKAEKISLIALPIIILVGIGLALAGSQGGVAVAGFPVFAIAIGLAFIIQWIAFIPAYLRQTEKFFDLTGSITFISVIVLAVMQSGIFFLLYSLFILLQYLNRFMFLSTI